jgi:hypothetical protein
MRKKWGEMRRRPKSAEGQRMDLNRGEDLLLVEEDLLLVEEE